MNTSRAYAALKKTKESQAALAAATNLDAQTTAQFAEVPIAGTEGSRASSSADVGSAITFVEDP